eukprot:TRINITY_DN5224_c0_g1_i1.p1 TRINITY_DN5224_c0_g1~~TRINITY_DN5224_c0_g1_i1.p1  ORF type:complete len:264 (-),score=38.32 TRINITY_DN5224_c0_g1_i1:57-848(-)
MEQLEHFLGLEHKQKSEYLAWGVLCISAPISIYLFNWGAPYGRYNSKPLFNLHAGISWFLFEVPNLIWVAVSLYRFRDSICLDHTHNLILLSVFTLHYINRSIIHAIRLKGSTPWSVLPVISAILYTTLNGYIQSTSLLNPKQCHLDWQYSNLRFVIGLVLMVVGFAINYQSDDILRNLRKGNDRGYKIPRGGMFEYVSGANYFGEIVEWIGFAIACWSIEATSFAVFTFVAIGSRGYRHHKWYLQKFEDYPKDRKAIIPFIL